MGVLIRALHLALLLSAWTSSALGQPPEPDGLTQGNLFALEAMVNGSLSGTWLFVERDGVFHAPREAFEAWHVQAPLHAEPIHFKGLAYWPLSAVPGLKITLDPANQTMSLWFAPEDFPLTRLTRELPGKPMIDPVLPSLFFNYDLNYDGVEVRDVATSQDLGMMGELGASNALGVLTHSAAGRNVTDSATAGTPRSWVRMQTTFTHDFPANNHTLRLGDSMTRAGTWGRNVHFGGVQFGSNFALTPGLWTQPLPVLSGSSAAPSTVELYVNNVLRQVANVPAGPFVLDNFPMMSGSGEARMVVRDILGRETVVTRDFFSNTRLLRTGLHDWSVETGRMRRNLGMLNADYGDEFASGLWRFGFNDALTLETRSELAPDQRNLGLGLTAALPGDLLGRVAGVISDAQTLGTGRQWLLGAEYLGRQVGAQIEVQRATESFRQLGLDLHTPPHKEQLMGSLSYRFAGDGSSIGLGFVSLVPYDTVRVFSTSANFSTRLGSRASLNFFATRSVADSSAVTVGVTLVLPLDQGRTIVASVSNQDGRPEAYVSASRNPGHAADLGWRVLAGQEQQTRRVEGALHYLGLNGQLLAEARASDAQNALRLGARGGLVLVENKLFATRRLDQSFALAEVKGYSNIGIGLGSNVLSRTDEDGIALIPQLLAYSVNQVRIDPRELPMSAEIDTIEQTVVPAWRSVVKVDFPVRGGRGALLKIVQEDQNDVPAGAVVQIEGDSEVFYVAHRGRAFVTGLQSVNRLRVTWKDRQCDLDLTLPAEKTDDILRIGPLTCQGSER